MNYKNIQIDNLNDEQIIIPKKNYYCSNCNRKNHTYKNCYEPIISNGIIAVYIENLNIESIPSLEKHIINNLKIFTNTYNKETHSPQYNKHLWLESDFRPKKFNENIKFLMVQRKNSLGYLEFIRGRYIIEDIKSIIHLLEQMTPNEINSIINSDFDILWNNLWDTNNIINKNHYK